MAIELYPDFFNDVFGPVMQAGSSSHLAGPSRLGQLSNHLLDEIPARIEVIMDAEGSFAGTFGYMSEDEGMASGAMNVALDDPRRSQWKQIAADQGTEVVFTKGVMKESEHINSMKFILTGANGKEVSLVGDSTGGGMCETKVMNGFPFRYKGDCYVLQVIDSNDAGPDLGAIEGQLSALLSTDTVAVDGLGTAHFFCFSDAPNMDKIRGLAATCDLYLTRPVLPVVTRPEKKPQLFDSMTQWREICDRENKSLYEVAIDYEIGSSGLTREEIDARLLELALMMRRQVVSVHEEEVDRSHHPYGVDSFDEQWTAHLNSDKCLTKGLLGMAIDHFFVSMTMPVGIPVVPGPHGAGGGIIASSVRAVALDRNLSDEDIMRGVTVGAAVGAICYTRAEPTGESMGCTGEMGISGAMAAAIIAEMVGGTPEQVEDAASLYLQQAIGMPCDPIPNGNLQPCLSRGLQAVVLPIVCADVALAGRKSVLPFHEVLDVAYELGKNLGDDLLCTSRGGCAACPTALRLNSKEAEAEGTGLHLELDANDDRNPKSEKCT